MNDDTGGPLATLAPEVSQDLDELRAHAWSLCDHELLALVRLRVATLLGAADHIDDPLVSARRDELPQWPTSPNFTERERACLDVAEQFVIDVSNVSDEQVRRLTDHMTPAEAYGFVCALYVIDYSLRVELVLDRLFES